MWYSWLMSLRLAIPEDFPRNFWMLDDVSPYADYSGYNGTAQSTSTNRGVALCKGAARSLIVSNSDRLVMNTNYFLRGKEYLPFSLGAFVRPIMTDVNDVSAIQILGNDGQMDGIVMEGTKISFVTKYANTGEARASFDVMDYQMIAVYGVHTKSKNMLYINGEVVSEADITPEQQADVFATAGGYLSSGATTSSNKLMLNAVQVYDTALDDTSVITHYAHAQDTLGAEDVALAYGGALLEFAPEGQLSPFYTIDYSSDSEWAVGYTENVSVVDGTLYPVTSGGISLSGFWENIIPLGTVPVNIYAATLTWTGTGATVLTSRDRQVWEPAKKAKALTTVPKGTNGEGQFLYIRVQFPGGIANDPSFFDDMVFSLYAFEEEPTFGGRTVVMDKVSLEEDFDVNDLQENWGAELQGGTLTIKSGDPVSTLTPKTIEVWACKGAGTFTDNLSSANTTYSNGGTLKTYAVGEWQVRHYVFNAGYTGDIVFSGTGQIGHVILYPNVLSADTVKEIYTAYTGKPKIYIDVDETFDIHEFPGLVDVYSYDWAIETAG